MISVPDLVSCVIRPVLKDIGLWSENAEKLVLGTCCVESACGQYLVQIGGGPALGIYQCEPATHEDIWTNFLRFRPELAAKVRHLIINCTDALHDELCGNLYYATAMCRVHYCRFPEPIPDTLLGQAQFWKLRYNTVLGAGTVEDYVAAWRRFVPDPVTVAV
jgi:hypothetical protein